MSVPIIMGIFSFAIMRFVDTWMVAQLPGDTALAAVGQAGLATFTLATFFVGVAGCVSTFASQSIGRGQPQNAARYAWQGIYIAWAAGFAVLAWWPLADPLFYSLGHPPHVAELESVYFRIRLLGFIFISWQCAMASFFQAVHRPHVPMMGAVFANLLNAVLDYLLIFGSFGFPRLEIAGAAWATVAAQAVEVAVLQTIFLSRRCHAEYGTRTAYPFDWTKVRELFRVGWPAGLTLLADVFNWSIFTLWVIGQFGETAMAAHNAVMQFIHLSFLPAVGLNQGIAAIVGRWVGRGDIARAKARTYTAMKLAMGWMTTVGIILALFGASLTRFFFSKDPEVVRMSHTLFMLAAMFQAFDAINIVLFGALRGAGDTRWTMFMTAAMGYGFFVPLAFLLAFTLNGGALGAWVAATVYIIVLSGVVLWRFHAERWRHVRIFEADLTEAPLAK